MRGAVTGLPGVGTLAHLLGAADAFENGKPWAGAANLGLSALTLAPLKAPAGGATAELYPEVAKGLDVSTLRSQAVFWSGPGNREAAEQFASDNGAMTLEMTPGGRWLDQQKLFDVGSPLTKDQATAVWHGVSETFASQSSGNVVGFVKGARAGSTFNAIEYPALVGNPNITNVVTGGF